MDKQFRARMGNSGSLQGQLRHVNTHKTFIGLDTRGRKRVMEGLHLAYQSSPDQFLRVSEADHKIN